MARTAEASRTRRDAARPGPLAHARHGVFGFMMGAADLVPGVSGGTVALVCGIYVRLVDAIRDAAYAAAALLRGRIHEALDRLKRLDWALLVPLLAGIGLAVVSLAAVIEHLLDEEPVRLAGLFLGLVLGSVVVAWRLIQRIDAVAVLSAGAVAIALFVLLGLREETTAEAANAAAAPVWAYPVSASLAICAMILPGISGSLLLVILGMYAHVLAAVTDRDFGLLLLFVAGAAVGLGLFSRLLAWLLANHHDRVIAAMIGLMIGSLRVLWPWPGGTSTTDLAWPRGDVVAPVLLALAGFVVVVVIGRLGALKEEPVPGHAESPGSPGES